MGKSSLVLDHHRVFVVCMGKGCDSFHVKKPRSNLGLECDKCIAVRNNEKRCAIRKETNKNMRIAANSSCPMRFLDNYELKDRVGRLNTNRNIKSQLLHRVENRLCKADMKYRLSEKNAKAC